MLTPDRRTRRVDDPGVTTFARYAFAPNELGYCGPEDFVELLHGEPSRIAERANEFEGAWAYLVTLAEAIGNRDPLDAAIVHAYWVGDDLLAQVDPQVLLDNLRARIRGPATGLLHSVAAAAKPPAHHNFHVLAVYPWVTLLHVDDTTPLSILQNCCIRAGEVESVHGDVARVSRRELSFDGAHLSLGSPTTAPARWRLPGHEMIAEPVAGLSVSLHWDWICGVLEPSEAAQLEMITQRVLDIVNPCLDALRDGRRTK
ncbi:DUF6390 family protein [Gordonia sp. SL306]|uniref:DUF6390 family protein n=1 Tax=Gordonia sp. SL306 TaxID=2995145 RepID=UPI00226EFF3D|nr:DUF6390 family protein [Gordonia sp. SL306]WAC53720.1 DUF6390 family protein [Gordonia sp. SL306]